MTVQQEVPDADAVYLYREELSDDDEVTFSFYYRIKILQAKGKEQARVVLTSSMDKSGKGSSILSFSGRTIDTDGTIIPMTERPVEDTFIQPLGGKTVRKTYNLPQPKIGSILEYRYTRKISGGLLTPTWTIQNRLFTRKAHYLWLLTKQSLSSQRKGETPRTVDSVRWTSRLPHGMDIKKLTVGPTDRPGFELNLNNIPPYPTEESQPPLPAIAYLVDFSYSTFDTNEAYWQDVGKAWSIAVDRYIGPGPGAKAAVAKLTSPSDTPEQKLRKLYQAVMEFDNLSVDRTQGVSQFNIPAVQSTDEILGARRGSNDQINDLFIAMVRAAGITAYEMRVANYGQHVFNLADRDPSGFDDNITVVVLDGKELFLDPGTRFCPFGHLSPIHSAVVGLRQSSTGPAISSTSVEPLRSNELQRVALLHMNDQGVVTGTVKLTYTGTAGTTLRQMESVKGEPAVRNFVKESLTKNLPPGMDVDIVSVDKAKDFEEPLTISANVRGPIAKMDGAKMMVKTGFFEQQEEQQFKSEARQQPVFLRVTSVVADVIQIFIPSSVSVAVDTVADTVKASEKINKDAAYDLSIESNAANITIRKRLVFGRLIYPVSDYPELRSFYAKIYARNQEPIVITRSAASASE
jgi:hypothetical protein